MSLFEQQRVEPLELLEPLEREARRAPNPFAKKTGDCCGQKEVRVYWCWKCGKTPGCWSCFEKHKC